MPLLLQWLTTALAILVTAYLLPGVVISSFFTAMVVAVVLGLVNAFIKPIFLLLTLPINILTLGLFTFVINAFMVLLTARLVGGFYVSSFGWALLFSLVLMIVSTAIDMLFKPGPSAR
jgi:putative membrane protein